MKKGESKGREKRKKWLGCIKNKTLKKTTQNEKLYIINETYYIILITLKWM